MSDPGAGSRRRLPDPVQEPTISVRRAGAILGMSRNAAYAAARTGGWPVLELSPHRRVVRTAAFLAQFNLAPAEAPAPQPPAPPPSAPRPPVESAVEACDDGAVNDLGPDDLGSLLPHGRAVQRQSAAAIALLSLLRTARRDRLALPTWTIDPTRGALDLTCRTHAHWRQWVRALDDAVTGTTRATTPDGIVLVTANAQLPVPSGPVVPVTVRVTVRATVPATVPAIDADRPTTTLRRGA